MKVIIKDGSGIAPRGNKIQLYLYKFPEHSIITTPNMTNKQAVTIGIAKFQTEVDKMKTRVSIPIQV